MASLGVVGLGNIGGAIARNLVADGHAVTVCDADATKVAALVDAGATAAATPAEVAAAAPVTLASLPTPEVVEAVAAEWLAGAPEDSIFVDLSTNAPATIRKIGAALDAGGCHLLESPLTGGAPGAQARMLVFMVGGEPVVFERVRPILDTIGRATFHVGPLGLGNVAKLVNSLIAFQATWGSLEVLALATKAGIDLRTMIDVVRTGGAGNVFTERMVDGVNERGRPAQFALALAAKDGRLFMELARELGVPATTCGAVVAALDEAVRQGLGDRDFTDLVELVERQAGVRLALAPPRDA